MTKKHFEAIALILKNEIEQDKAGMSTKGQSEHIARLLASEVFEQENPRFDCARFLKACGVKP